MTHTKSIKTSKDHNLRLIKEMNDANIIDSGVKAILDFGKDDLLPHFIYCGAHYTWTRKAESRFEEIFLTKMKSKGIQYAALTILAMWRHKLVTKETVKKAYQGKLKNAEDWEIYQGSINNDLETFFTNLQNRQKIKNEKIASFFTPKLTEEELTLVQKRNEQHLCTYGYHAYGGNPDVDPEEMKKSDSRSKYVHGICYRRTIPLTLESNQKQATDKNIPKTKKKCILL